MMDFDAQGVRNNGFAHLSGSHVGTVERKVPTELKGTTYITHHFESNESHLYAKPEQMNPYTVSTREGVSEGGARE